MVEKTIKFELPQDNFGNEVGDYNNNFNNKDESPSPFKKNQSEK